MAQVPQAAVGVLGLHPETVQRALTDQALGLLLPPTLLVTFHPCDPPVDPHQLSTASENQQGPSAQVYEPDQQSSPSASQAGSQPYSLSAPPSQQSSQWSSHQTSQGPDESLPPSDSGYGWRRLSGGPDGAGFGGNRGNLWAMVAPVGALIPMTMRVRQHPLP